MLREDADDERSVTETVRTARKRRGRGRPRRRRAITIAGTDVTLFDDVGFGEAVYAEAPAGQHQLCVCAATEDDDGEVAASFDVDLAGGAVYSAFAVGYLAPEEAPADEPFDLVVTEDAIPEGDGDGY